jgi:hypothetical protein
LHIEQKSSLASAQREREISKEIVDVNKFECSTPKVLSLKQTPFCHADCTDDSSELSSSFLRFLLRNGEHLSWKRNESYNSFPGLLDFVEGQLSCRGVELICKRKPIMCVTGRMRVGKTITQPPWTTE